MSYKDNFGIMIPQTFMTDYNQCIVNVHFEFKGKWDEFKKWIDDGNLKQLNIDGGFVDVWVRRNTDLYGDHPGTLQFHFNEYCSPKEYTFTSFPLNTTGK